MWIFGDWILRTCANSALRAPWLVLAVTLVLTVLAGWATTRLTINTSTEDILAAELPFRQAEIKFRAAFPERDLAVAVVDAPYLRRGGERGKALLDRVRARPEFFKWSELAGSSPYFDRNGLLFLDPEQIQAVGNQLRQARSLLVDLARDPSLRGMAELLDNAEFGVAESAAPPELAGLLTQFAGTVEQRAQGRPAEMRWRSVFSIGPDPRGTRRVVQIDPVLDDSSLDRAAPALSALDKAIAEVHSAQPQVTMRVTGLPVLRQQELNDAFSGALYASGLSFVLVAATLIFGIRSAG
jgi:predicted RND superfamily exporter protein